MVDVPAIIKFCPKLESLYFWYTNCTTTNQSTATKLKSPVILHNLKKLTISSDATISSENLLALLSSPSLSYISISKCDALTDDIFQRTMNLHSFRNLEYLTLDDSNAVSKKAIDNIFLQDFNPLKKIFLSETINGGIITRKNYIDWNENAIWIKKNWQFKFMLKRSYYDDNGTRIHLGEHKDIGGPWWYEHSDLIELLVYHRFCLNGRLLYDFSGLLGPPVRDRALI